MSWCGWKASRRDADRDHLHGAPVYRLRGNLLPLVYLNRELQLGRSPRPASAAVNIVVLQADDRQFGLVVDEINDTEEIVVKPLGKQLKGLACFAGATIMGDGQVALILDVLGLAQMTRVVSDLREQNVAKQGLKAAESAAQRESWLLFRIGKDGRMAIPLSLVSRLEEFPATQVERYAGHEVIQYRQQIMPLVRLAEALGYAGAGNSELLQVIVYSEQRPQRRPGGGRDPGHRGSVGGGAANPPGENVEGGSGDPAAGHRPAGCARAAGSPAAGGRRRSAGMKQRRQLCTFYLQKLLFGVEVEKVQEVIRYQEMTRIPLSPEVIGGLINLRGQIVTALDLRRQLALAARDRGELPMNVVIRRDDGPISLLVDEIGDVVEVDEQLFEPAPDTLDSRGREFIRGVYKLKQQLLLLLDTEKAMSVVGTHPA